MEQQPFNDSNAPNTRINYIAYKFWMNIDHLTFIAFVYPLINWRSRARISLRQYMYRWFCAARGKFHLFLIHRCVSPTSMYLAYVACYLFTVFVDVFLLFWNVSSNLLFALNPWQQHELLLFPFLLQEIKNKRRIAKWSKQMKWSSTGIFL